jgi:hypothetical protein
MTGDMAVKRAREAADTEGVDDEGEVVVHEERRNSLLQSEYSYTTTGSTNIPS